MTTTTFTGMPTRTKSSAALRLIRSTPALLLGIAVLLGLLALVSLSSIAFGAADIDGQTVLQAVFSFDPESTNHLIIRTLRVPRAAVAALVGGALALAGALMQGLTRNPLGDTGILGINTGAALAVVAAVFFLGISSLSLYALFAFAGAALTAVVVYGLGSIGRGDRPRSN